MPDSGEVWVHFAAAIDAYRRAGGVRTWQRLETDIRQLGAHSAFVSVHWNALDVDELIVRDTWTSYHLLDTEEVRCTCCNPLGPLTRGAQEPRGIRATK